MKTKTILVIAVFLIILSIIMPTANASTNVEFSINSKNGIKAGKEFPTIVRIDNIPEQEQKPSGIKFDLFYDKDVLEVVSIKKKDTLNGTFEINKNYPDEGRIRMGFAAIGGLQKSGELYEIKFKAKEKLTKKECELRIEVKELTDSENNSLQYITKNGTIKFAGKIETTRQENIDNQEQKENTDGQENNTETTENENSQNEEQKNSAKKDDENGTNSEETQSAENITDGETNNEKTEEKNDESKLAENKNKKNIVLIGIIGIVVLIIGGGIFVIKRKNKGVNSFEKNNTN